MTLYLKRKSYVQVLITFGAEFITIPHNEAAKFKDIRL